MSDYDDLIGDLARSIFNNENRNIYSPELVQKTAKDLTEAISEGYGNIGIDWDTPDHLMIEKLIENVFSFSAAKNYHQLRDITYTLKDEKGKLREFSDFKKQIEDLGYKYNTDWLQTEYQTAVASSTMAARWVEYQKEADIFPMLQYQTVGDSRVRVSHQLLDGTIKPINDPFWSTYYPPNGWNCRCDVLQVPESDVKPINPVELPYVPDMFKTNLAKNGLLFPKDHPYYEGVPKDVLRRSMQYLPKDYAFRSRKQYVEHAMLQYEPEANENREIAKALSKTGLMDIKLMPRLHEKEANLRVKLYGKDYCDKHPTKCPDSFISGEAVEFKEAGRNNMSKRILEASTQADIIVLKTKEILTDEYIERFIKGQWRQEDRKNVKEIIIISDNKVNRYKRPL